MVGVTTTSQLINLEKRGCGLGRRYKLKDESYLGTFNMDSLSNIVIDLTI